jgi:hypothetical protein
LPEDSLQAMNAKEVVIAMLSVIDRLATESMPLPTENRFYERPLKEPFCVEATTQTLTTILSIIADCRAKISKGKSMFETLFMFFQDLKTLIL